MRALFDANIFISHLLYPTAETPPAVAVRAGLVGRCTLLISETVVVEIRRKVADKRWLASRIPGHRLETFLALLVSTAEIVPDLLEAYPAVGSDRNDDYLFAHALLGDADYLVSGDVNVLRVEQFEGVRIVSPSQFIDIFEQAGAV